MKKALPKLVLRKETVRTLSNKALESVGGGGAEAAQLIPQSGDKQCTALALVPVG